MKRARGKRRAVVIHPSDEMYGADKVLLEVLSSVPDDLEIEVWLPTDVEYPRRELSSALEERKVRYRHLPLAILRRAYMRPRALPGLMWRAIRTSLRLIQIRPDMVYINTAASAMYIPAARLSGARAILHLHEYLGPGSRVIVPFLFLAHRIIAVSRAIVQPLPSSLHGRTRVIYNGFDLPAPASLPRMDDGIVCVIASRWNAWKGHAILIEAFGRVRRNDLQLKILGAAPPNGEGADVEALVARCPRNGQIEVVGQAETRTYIDNGHVVIVPSVLPDPLPTVAIEALAAGRYVVGSRVGGMEEILGELGTLVQPGAVDAWVEALEQLDVREIRTHGERGRARFEEMFSRDRFLREIAEVLWT